MQNVPGVVLQPWQAEISTDGQTTVLPDGCRDLIRKHRRGEKPKWFVSPVACSPDIVPTTAGDQFVGFRLQAGVQVDEAGLLASLSDDMTEIQALDRLMHFTSQDPKLTEALACLAQSETSTVAGAAKIIGVHTRRLQRMVTRQTGHSPVFWLRLARVRRAAANIKETMLLADLAYAQGYADQAHMTREFRHWLGVTPRRIKTDAGWKNAHMGLGYGA